MTNRRIVIRAHERAPIRVIVYEQPKKQGADGLPTMARIGRPTALPQPFDPRRAADVARVRPLAELGVLAWAPKSLSSRGALVGVARIGLVAALVYGSSISACTYEPHGRYARSRERWVLGGRKRPDHAHCPRPLRAAATQGRQLGRTGLLANVHAARGQRRRRAVAV
jgi:hypothetical protein